MKSFLKWAGGKGQMVDVLVKLIRARRSYAGRYFEPFLGSGAVALSLSEIDVVASDSNEELVETWTVVKQEPHRLSKHLEWHRRDHSKEHYYEVRSRRYDTPVERAARFIYLNKTGFNGLYRKNRSGQFNVPIGRGRATSIPTYGELMTISQHVNRYWSLVHSDFEPIIEEANEGDVVYADPPYAGTFGYSSDFSEFDRERLAAALRRAARRGVGVVATDANTRGVRRLYSWAEITPYDERRRIAANGDRRDAKCLIAVRP